MKTTFKLAFVACLMMLSSACHAQKPIPAIDQAFINSYRIYCKTTSLLLPR